MVTKTWRSNVLLPVGAIVLALLFRGCLLTLSFFVLPHLHSPRGFKIVVQSFAFQRKVARLHKILRLMIYDEIVG